MKTVTLISDEQLIERYGKLCGFVAWVFVRKSETLGKEDAEDIAADAQMKLIKCPQEHRGESAYINHLVKNAVITSWRKKLNGEAHSLMQEVEAENPKDQAARLALELELEESLETFLPSKETVSRILYELRPLYKHHGNGRWLQFLLDHKLQPRTVQRLIADHEVKIGVRTEVEESPEARESIVSDNLSQTFEKLSLVYTAEQIIELRQAAHIIAERIYKDDDWEQALRLTVVTTAKALTRQLGQA